MITVILLDGRARAVVRGRSWATSSKVAKSLLADLPQPGPEDGDPETFLALKAVELIGGRIEGELPEISVDPEVVY